MSSDHIEILERVRFKGQAALTWERSFDGGQTWEDVIHGLPYIPFVRLDRSGPKNIEVIRVIREPNP